MDEHVSAEKTYQQGRHYAGAVLGERTANLQRAIACYETALQYYTPEAFPTEWRQIQQEMANAYSELVQERLKQAQRLPTPARTARRPRLTLPHGLLVALLAVVILAIPATAIATTYLVRGGPTCVTGTLNLDGSTVLQPLIEVVADDYMRHCPGTLITVGGGASKTGLAHVEAGYGVITGVKQQHGRGRLNGRDVPIQIGDSDIFASPTQHDLVDHQVAIGVFALILNHEVTGLRNLSTSQIQGIYTGLYQNWRQVCDHGSCGPDLAIVSISRTVNSGTRYTFEKYVLRGVATVPGIGLNRTSASGNAVQEVGGTSGSIGYAPLALASQAHDVTILSIDGRDPRDFSLTRRDEYKFWNIEHMYTRGPGSPLAQSFLNYLYSYVTGKPLSRLGLLHLSDVPQDIRDKHVLESA